MNQHEALTKTMSQTTFILYKSSGLGCFVIEIENGLSLYHQSSFLLAQE
jgi:hypothetical protein